MKYLFEGAWQETESHFIGAVDESVVRAIERTSGSFGEVLKELPGVYPGEALESIRRLTAQGNLPPDFFKGVLEETKRRNPSRHKKYNATKGSRLEHPLDFEWLFSKAGRTRIIDTVDQLAQGRNWTILCMGCPSIFKMGSDLNRHNFRLLDKNASSWGQLFEANALMNIDLVHDTVPDFQIDAAIIDPPWYCDFYRLFIWSALMLTRPGGKILISVPQTGTRPSAEQDVATLLSWCAEGGLTLIDRHRGFLPYRAPLFELNALKAQGIHNVPYDWRRGDLLILEKTRSVPIAKPSTPLASNVWRECRSGLVRFKFKDGDETSLVPALRPIVPNAVIPSVSTRYPGRNSANFVTSGNRFYVTSSPMILERLCEELSETTGAQFRLRAPRDNHLTPQDRMRRRLQNLFQLEQKEAETYLAETWDV